MRKLDLFLQACGAATIHEIQFASVYWALLVNAEEDISNTQDRIIQELAKAVRKEFRVKVTQAYLDGDYEL